MDKVYENVKALTGGMKNRVTTKIKDKNGRILSNENDVLNRWKLYSFRSKRMHIILFSSFL